MATKADLEAREAECASVEDFVNLALEALADPSDADYAKTLLEKAEEQCQMPPDYIKTANTAAKLGDMDYAAEVYTRAADSLGTPNDLMNLAANIVSHIGDKTRAETVYRKALEKAADFSQLIRLLDRVNEDLGDKQLARDILVKAVEACEETPELIETGQRVIALLDDRELAARIFENADERVTSLGEMRAVAEAVKSNFADDEEWIGRVGEKLANREANQTRYAAFQSREAAARTLMEMVALTDAIVAELGDRFYARKVLNSAEEELAASGNDFTQRRLLVDAVSRHLADIDWAKRLLDEAAAECTQFSALRAVGEAALESFTDKQAGRDAARGYYRTWEKQLDASDTRTAYDYTKLAAVILRQLGDAEWARAMIGRASEIGGDHFAFAHMGVLAAEAGDSEGAGNLFERAAAACESASQLAQLAARLIGAGVEKTAVRAIYASAKDRLTDPLQRLSWAEDIVSLFGDKAWATREYDSMEGQFADPTARMRFAASRKFRLDGRL